MLPARAPAPSSGAARRRRRRCGDPRGGACRHGPRPARALRGDTGTGELRGDGGRRRFSSRGRAARRVGVAVFVKQPGRRRVRVRASTPPVHLLERRVLGLARHRLQREHVERRRREREQPARRPRSSASRAAPGRRQHGTHERAHGRAAAAPDRRRRQRPARTPQTVVVVVVAIAVWGAKATAGGAAAAPPWPGLLFDHLPARTSVLHYLRRDAINSVALLSKLYIGARHLDTSGGAHRTPHARPGSPRRVRPL